METELPSPKRGTAAPTLFGPCLLWRNGWMDHDATRYEGRPRPSFPPPQKIRGTAPNFRLVCCGQTTGWIRMPLGTEVGLGPGDVVLDGDPAPPKKGHSPHFSIHVYCGHRARWIKMPLGTKVGLGPGHIVLGRNPLPPEKRHNPPILAHVYCGQTVAHLSYC